MFLNPSKSGSENTLRLVSILVLFLAAVSFAELIIDINSEATSIPTHLLAGKTHVPLPRLANVLGYSWKWDEKTGVFTALRKSDTISCFEDRNYVLFNDGAVMQIPCSPERYRGTVLIACDRICSIFTAEGGEKLYLNKVSNRLVLKESVVAAQKPAVEPVSTMIPIDNVWGKEGIKRIVIDPGHGGKDPGALGVGRVKEKDLVLGIGLALRDALKENGFIVYMTRQTDKFLSLRERTAFANQKKADLFVSIHADAIPGSRKKKESIKGFKIYFLSDAKSEEDRLVAMRENAVVELEENNDSQDYLHNILTEMVSAEHLIESQDLSIMIAESFEKSLRETRKLHRGVGQARFFVLNGAYMPAVLVETGFVSNSIEAKLLSTRKYQKKMADALLTAIIDFKKKYEIGL